MLATDGSIKENYSCIIFMYCLPYDCYICNNIIICKVKIILRFTSNYIRSKEFLWKIVTGIIRRFIEEFNFKIFFMDNILICKSSIKLRS